MKETIRRYFILYLYFIRFSLTKTLQFRVNFFFRIIMDIVYAVILIAFYDIIYGKTSMLGGWDKGEAFVFVGACLVVDALQMTLISDNLNNFADKVNKGDLDYYLVRPVSPLFFLSLREISANSAINLLIAIGIFSYYIAALPGALSLSSIVWFLILLMNGAVLYYLTRLLFVLPVFWLGSIRGLDTLFYNLYYVVDRPDKIFRGVTRLLLTIVAPFCVMVSFPTRAFFHGSEPLLIAHIFGVTVALSLVVRYVWSRCLRAYSSASS